MLRQEFALRTIAVLLFAGVITACAGDAKKESAGEYVDDTVITSKVKAKILQDPKLKVLQINVETFKGVVQLSGFVESASSAERAVAVARDVKGVRRVENKMTVK